MMTWSRRPNPQSGLRSILLASFVVAGSLTGCSGDADDARVVSVFAAASLTNAFTVLEVAFEDAHPDLDLQFNFAGSSTLREQILEGAPVDVFAAANESIMQQLVESGDVQGPPVVFASNRLMIAVPVDNPGDVDELGDLDRDELLIGLCAAGVPCGDLAREVLDQAGVVVVSDTDEPDVRALLAKIAAGELDAGLVYASDVAAFETQVVGIDLPNGLLVESRYPIARMSASLNPAGADTFVEFVQSAKAVEVLADAGFQRP